MAIVLKILNHDLSPEQISALEEHLGEKVYLLDLPESLRRQVLQSPATTYELQELAKEVAETAAGFDAVILPAGSPAFMFCLALQLKGKLVRCLFAHSRREAVEERQPDGSVRKTSVFRFEKWIEVWS